MASSLQVSEVRDRAELGRMEPEWDGLLAQTPAHNSIFLRHAFIRIWLDNFAPRARLRVLVARDGQGALQAVLPLMERRVRVCGVPVRALVSTSNPHSCRFDLVARDGEAASRAFFQHLAGARGWDVLRVGDVPEGGHAWHLHQAFEQDGFPVGGWESLRSPYVPLPPRWDDLAARLSSKLKANLRRRRRKLEEKGRVTYERFHGGEDLEARLDAGFALEASGWKGQRGTAIAQSVATRGFYTELARWASREGALSLRFLQVGGRPVAFHYALTAGDGYFLLKPGYDESLHDCSPGQLLMEDALKDCVAQGLRELDFLGPDMVWKRDWTDRTRVHTWLFAFRDSRLGRALCRAKFRWIPAAKEALARWKRRS
ncbi:MAG TPA: GNAT family N-acetyltransferase [Myxococcales bacterium]|jgi:CelD/BcsL family acetyltransferase involved in cellulose biosynthesis|nr:GNAT family N-acetyltransferase [Myxococcales bacterium]